MDLAHPDFVSSLSVASFHRRISAFTLTLRAGRRANREPPLLRRKSSLAGERHAQDEYPLATMDDDSAHDDSSDESVDTVESVRLGAPPREEVVDRVVGAGGQWTHLARSDRGCTAN